jgi:fructose-1,6-bisphosphatase/inositol monophosphatase family enzyme
LDQDLIEDLAGFAGRLADASGPLIRDAHRDGFAAEAKGDGSPVTDVDRAVEDRLRAMIAAAHPSHGVVDPIDGTLPFLAGIPVFGTLIALIEDGAPLIGIIDMPATRERWIGCEGMATTRNGEPVNVRACEVLSAALLSTSNPDFYGEADIPALQRLKAATRWTVYGGSCMSYAQIASGRIDIGIDVAFDPFDYLALVPVIRGAGGVITDWDGNPLTLESGDRLIAAGDSRTHAQALAILANS